MNRKKTDKAQRSSVPDTAQVSKPDPLHPAWERAPHVAEGNARRAEIRLKDTAARIRTGDLSDLPRLEQPAIGVSARGLAPSNHWLPHNRFDWFEEEIEGEKTTRSAPLTDAIKIRPPASPAPGEPPPIEASLSIDALRDEFASPLSTVVGADLQGLLGTEYGQSKLWTNLRDGASPNELPGIELVVRESPGSVPVLRTLPLRRGGLPEAQRKVLVNEGDFETEPGQTRPPLVIDFPQPQRAVALEFGFVTDEQPSPGEGPPSINPDQVVLIAWDRERNQVSTSSAADIPQDSIAANFPTYVIGVRQAEGAIASVELHFRDPEDAGKVQIVSRIWHEALPPAAVLQGTLVTEVRRGSVLFMPEPVLPAPVLPEPKDRDGKTIPLGSKTIQMPFRFNRGMVMLRGFKLETLDQTPHEVHRIGVGVNPRVAGGRISQTPGVFRFERGGSVDLEPSGNLVSSEEGALGTRVHIYFTLVGWDSDQVDVVIAQGEQTESVAQDEFALGNPLVLANPCPMPSVGCGGLFGAVQGFDFRMPEDQEVEEIQLLTGVDLRDSPGAAGLRAAGFAHVPQTEAILPELRQAGYSLEWGISSYLSGGDWRATSFDSAVPSPYSRFVRGAVLTGPSVRVRSLLDSEGRFVGSIRGVVARPSPSTFFEPTLTKAIDGDLAFVGFGGFVFEPDGPIREMEVELLGKDYDGRTLQWQEAAGLSIESVEDSDSGGPAAPIPTFGTLSRRALAPRTGLIVQHLEFRGHVGLLANTPSPVGAIFNEGNIPAVITNIRRGGPQSLDFSITLYQRDQVLTSWSPIVIMPGESLLVGGAFFPQTPAGANDPLYEAFLDFETNVASQRVVRMNITGRTSAEDPMGEVLPPVLNFGLVPLHILRPRLRNAILSSTGPSPLLVRSIHLEDHDFSDGPFPTHLGAFSWRIINPGLVWPPTPGSQYQLDRGEIMIIEVAFTPMIADVVQTRLIFETNAGVIAMSLIAQVTSQ